MNFISRADISLENKTLSPSKTASADRVRILDGWRAVSICLVLAAHMLPLGPHAWNLNSLAGTLGMVIFFNLSGLLIVRLLLKDQSVPAFLLKRFTRILPLAWLTLLVVLTLAEAGRDEWLANLFFYANLPPYYLDNTAHFWSLCIEMQFYVLIAGAVAFVGKKALYLAPLGAAAVTVLRIWNGVEISIVTWMRLDEILAGASLALILANRSAWPCRMLVRLPWIPIAMLCVLSASPDMGAMNYLRPYLSAAMIGISVLRPLGLFSRALESPSASYLAQISYALYVLHPYSMSGWLGAGAGWEKYVKRVLCFVLTFAGAHLSTFSFEAPINRWAHRATQKGAFIAQPPPMRPKD